MTPSVVLVDGAGFVRNVRNVHAIKLGYDVDRLTSATVRFDAGDEIPADFQDLIALPRTERDATPVHRTGRRYRPTPCFHLEPEPYA
jgi:hypothetical protein